MKWTGPGTALIQLPRTVDLSRSARLSARVVLDPASAGTVGLAVRDTHGRTATLASSGAPIRPLTQGTTELRLWAQNVWVDPARFRGIDLAHITEVGLATQGSGRAWLVDMSRRTASPAPPAWSLPVADLADTSVTVAGGETVLASITVRLNRPAPRGAVIRVRVPPTLDPTIVPGIDQLVQIQPGARTATVSVPVTMPEAVGPGAAGSSQVVAYPVSGATSGVWRASLNIIPVGVRIRRLSPSNTYATTSPGGVLTWDFSASDPGPVRVSAVIDETDLDYADLDPQFRRARLLPDSGPITDFGRLRLQSEQVDDARIRLELPLSANARAHTFVTLSITGVQGAEGTGLPGLNGEVTE
jgi:hypothetical protein